MELVRGYLRAHDLSQSEVAGAARVDAGLFSRWLNGKAAPDAIDLIEVGRAIERLIIRRNNSGNFDNRRNWAA